MDGIRRLRRVRFTETARLTGLLVAVWTSGSCAQDRHEVWRENPAPSQNLTILSAYNAGTYYEVAAALVGVYNDKLPNTAVKLATSGGSAKSMDAVDAGQGDLTFGRSDVVYFAFQQGTERNPKPYKHLRSIAILNANAMHIVARQASGIWRMQDLRGRRVSLGTDPSGGGHARNILESYGLRSSDVLAETTPGAEAAERLKAGTLDAAFFELGIDYPLPIVTELSQATPVRLLSIGSEMIAPIRSRLPFFRPVVIPASTYQDQAEAVSTVGVDNIVFCRDALPDQLVYELTRLLFEALPGLSRQHAMVRMINPEHASATPIPLHAGAARYYRERELFR